MASCTSGSASQPRRSPQGGLLENVMAWLARSAVDCLLRTVAAVLLASVAGLAGASSALASETFTTFGSEGEGAGQLDRPSGIAVDTSNGRLYVADAANGRVDVFDSSGNFIMAFGWGVATGANAPQTCTTTCHAGLSGAGAGELGVVENQTQKGIERHEGAQGVAVDNDPSSPSYHDVYVVDRLNLRIEKFKPNGEFILMFGGEVNKTTHENLCTASSGDACGAGITGAGPGQFSEWVKLGSDISVDSSGRVWVGDVNRVEIFEQDGVYSSQIELPGDYGRVEALAVDPSGDFYTVAGGRGLPFAVRKYGPAGELLYTIGEGGLKLLHAIATDATGDLFVYRPVANSDKGYLSEYNSSGVELVRFGYEVPNGEPEGIAPYSGALGNLYYTESDFGSSRVVAVSAPPPVPVVVPGEVKASQVENTYATLDAAVDPEGAKTTYSFQYVDAADFEHNGEGFSSPATRTSSSATVGPDFNDDPLTLQISGLASETTYRFRVLVSSECEPAAHPGKQCKAVGEEATFTTLPPVTVDATKIANLGFESVELQAAVNPLGTSTTGYFQYVSQASYAEHGFEGAVDVPDVAHGAAPIVLGSGTVDREVAAQLSGLAPAAQYDFRFVGTNSGGTADGPVRAFETYPLGIITGLPDGRVYELVTPAFKNGNSVSFPYKFDFGLASADGDAVVYPMNGAAGAATAGMIDEYVSRRTAGAGWSTASVTSRPTNQISPFDAPLTVVPSSDFSKFLYADRAPFVTGDEAKSANIFIGEDPFKEPEWISRPQIENSVPALGASVQGGYAIAGASPDLGVVYFTYSGTLLPEDEERGLHVGKGTSEGEKSNVHPWGLYEWSGGSLHEAGVLPDGSLNPFGAVPAGLGLAEFNPRLWQLQAGDANNAVSADGTHLFFVSPDPISSSASNPAGCKLAPVCTSEPPQLYVREALPGGSRRVTLVSGSQLSGSTGTPAAHGVAEVSDAAISRGSTTFAFASADGSHVFFASTDRLTEAAPEDPSVKEYDYDVSSGSLTYLPGVTGGIATATRDGSELLFVDRTRAPEELKVWREGPNGGTVTSVAELPDAAEGCEKAVECSVGLVTVRSAHVSSDGSVFVFVTNGRVPGFNNDGETTHGGSSYEVYRYDVSSGGLNCISCPPVGVKPSGEAIMSYATTSPSSGEVENTNGKTNTGGPSTTIETRGMSADGSRVFFDTPDALVPGDTNGERDVYEWENGKVYLISSGTSPEESFYLDNSESGSDVFFTTSTGLVPGDTDGAYDVYDARIPRPGDVPPPAAVPCKGSICQGPPSVPQLLGEPASATFSGLGNVTVETVAKSTAKKKATKSVKKKKHKKKKGRKARSLGARANHARSARASRAGGHRNGRGK